MNLTFRVAQSIELLITKICAFSFLPNIFTWCSFRGIKINGAKFKIKIFIQNFANLCLNLNTIGTFLIFVSFIHSLYSLYLFINGYIHIMFLNNSSTTKIKFNIFIDNLIFIVVYPFFFLQQFITFFLQKNVNYISWANGYCNCTPGNDVPIDK